MDQTTAAMNGFKLHPATDDMGNQPSFSMDEFTGTYLHPGYGELQVTLDENKTLAATYHSRKIRMLHRRDDIFEVEFEPGWKVPITFCANGGGGINALGQSNVKSNGSISHLSAQLNYDPTAKEIIFVKEN